MFTQEWLKHRNLFYDGNSLPYNPLLKKRARILRQNMTPAERKLWYLFLSRLPDKFLRQRPIDHYIMDFYCPVKKLVIEVDGESHFSKEGVQYDKERSKILNDYGLTDLRFTNQDIATKFDAVSKKILGSLGKGAVTQ